MAEVRTIKVRVNRVEGSALNGMIIVPEGAMITGSFVILQDQKNKDWWFNSADVNTSGDVTEVEVTLNDPSTIGQGSRPIEPLD